MTTLFSVVLLLAIGIAVLLFAILIDNSIAQQKINKLLSAFNDAANNYGLWFSKHEVIGDRIIDFDGEKNKLLFLVRSKKKYDHHLVDLEKIESLEVQKKYVKKGAPHIRHLGVDASVESVGLQLSYAYGEKTLSLPFYEKAKDPIYELRNRTEQAKEWQLLLSDRIIPRSDSRDLTPGHIATATV